MNSTLDQNMMMRISRGSSNQILHFNEEKSLFYQQKRENISTEIQRSFWSILYTTVRFAFLLYHIDTEELIKYLFFFKLFY